MQTTQMTVVPKQAQLPALVAVPPSKPPKSKPNDVKFLHLRHHRPVAKLTGTFMELLPKGGCTIAYMRVKDVVSFAWAQCCPKDVFSKKLGRRIAQSRLEAGMGDFDVLDEKATRTELNQWLRKIYIDHEETWYPDADKMIY